MNYHPLSALLTAFFMVGLVVAFAKPKTAKRITVIFLIIAAAGGVLIYGYAYATMSDNWLLAVLRTIPAVCGMFLGEDNHRDVEEIPLMQDGWFHALFWIVHCYAIFTTVSAVVTTIFNRMIRGMQLRLSRRSRVYLMYGINGSTVKLGQEIAKNKRNVLVYVAEQMSPADKESIEAFGGLVRTDAQALSGSKAFLKSIGCRKSRRITLYALQDDHSENFRYAGALLKALEARNVPCENTRLVICAQEQMTVSRLQVTEGKYGFGYVSAFNGAMLSARMLTREYPPCNYIHFDKDGKATENFEALVIGFGQVGQAVLKNLIMSGQFEGSTFRATVFAPDCLEASGSFSRQFDELQSRYNIRLMAENARSSALYEYLKKQGGTLKYVAVCAGSDKVNREVAEDIATYCGWLHLKLPIFLCSQRSLKACDSAGVVQQIHSLYQPELLTAEGLDRRAMLLNHQYQQDKTKTPIQHWMECPYFDRQSSRAAADFADALVRAAGMTTEEVSRSGWELTDAQKENLSRHEHLRWWAFHSCMGYRTMDKAMLDARGAIYLEQLARGETPIRITRDTAAQYHACMVPWEELPVMAAWEAAYTGKLKDYHDADTRNVLLVPALLNLEAQQ